MVKMTPMKSLSISQGLRRCAAGCVAVLGLLALPVQAAQQGQVIPVAGKLALKSGAAFVVDQDSGEVFATKNADTVMPIASLTKLMTALVVVDAHQPMDEVLEIGQEDVDTVKRTHSRLKVGTRLKRGDMLLLALMSSENRAAMSLSRHYPGGRTAFIAQMNAKARELGMTSTRYADPAGLSMRSVSTARDLQRLLKAAYQHPTIRSDSSRSDAVMIVGGRPLKFVNSNRLVRSNRGWDIELQKTGFTNEAGRCLVMQVNMMGRRLGMIFLNSFGTLTRYADAGRVRRLLEANTRLLQRPLAAAKSSIESAP